MKRPEIAAFAGALFAGATGVMIALESYAPAAVAALGSVMLGQIYAGYIAQKKGD